MTEGEKNMINNVCKCFTITTLRSAEQIALAEKLLVKTGIYGGCELFYPYDVSDEIKKNYETNIQRFLKYPNFRVVLHLPYGSKNNIASYQNLENVMNRLREAILFASKYHAEGVTLHPGELDGTLSKEEAFDLAIKNTQILCDYAKQFNITVMVENMIGQHELCLTIKEMKEYQSRVNRENLGITLDCGHYHAAKQTEELPKSLVKYVETFKNKIKHLHLHDNSGERDEHGQMGTGTIDFDTYFKALKSVEYTGLYGSEVLFKDYSELLETSRKIDEFVGKKCQPKL